MSKLDNYECEGQMELTDYLSSQIVKRDVMDLTSWINSQGKAQYGQIGDVVNDICERMQANLSKEQKDRITNAVSIYVLEMSMGYMDYLRRQSKI
ncbi:MAG: hypothetical protein E7293_03275 [Lachnospiraceae bacterium]|nr:hypothetical protein [Lachnospiraceae bacterium]